MKKLHFVLMIFIILFVPNVFALEVDVTNSITSPNSPTQGKYQGTEIYNTGGDFIYNVNTRYNGRLSRIRFNLPLPDTLGSCFTTNVDYKVTMNMATSDWRNKFGSVTASAYGTNFAHYSTVFVSQKKIYFTFKIPSSTTDCIDYVFVDLKSTDVSNTAFTGETNWNLQSIKLTDPTISSDSGGSSPTPTPKPDYSDIINNQNENANNIINNQNDNTNNIIENNNQSTESIVNSITDGANAISSALSDKCSNLLDVSNIYQNNVSSYTLIDNGIQLIGNDTWQNVIYRIPVENGKKYYFSGNFTSQYDNSIIISLSYNGNNSSDLLENQFYNFDGSSSNSWSTNFVSNTSGYVYLGVWVTKGNVSNNASYLQMMFSPLTSSYCPFNSTSNKLDDVNNSINNSTSTIINNQNQNTQQQIDSQKVCELIDKNKVVEDGYLNGSGSISPSNQAGITDYIKIEGVDIKVLESYNNPIYMCFYTLTKTKISCQSENDIQTSNLNIPNNAFYVRFSINTRTNTPQFELCRDGNQAISDTLTDSNVDNGVGSGFFDDFTSQDFGLSQIVTIPLNTIQSLTSKSCVPLQVPIPFTNNNLTLPCMTEIYENRFSSIYNLWKIVSFGIVAYLIAIDIFHIVKGFKDPESDKVEVLDL